MEKTASSRPSKLADPPVIESLKHFAALGNHLLFLPVKPSLAQLDRLSDDSISQVDICSQGGEAGGRLPAGRELAPHSSQEPAQPSQCPEAAQVGTDGVLSMGLQILDP